MEVGTRTLCAVTSGPVNLRPAPEAAVALGARDVGDADAAVGVCAAFSTGAVADVEEAAWGSTRPPAADDGDTAGDGDIEVWSWPLAVWRAVEHGAAAAAAASSLSPAALAGVGLCVRGACPCAAFTPSVATSTASSVPASFTIAQNFGFLLRIHDTVDHAAVAARLLGCDADVGGSAAVDEDDDDVEGDAEGRAPVAELTGASAFSPLPRDAVSAEGAADMPLIRAPAADGELDAVVDGVSAAGDAAVAEGAADAPRGTVAPADALCAVPPFFFRCASAALACSTSDSARSAARSRVVTSASASADAGPGATASLGCAAAVDGGAG